MKISAVFILSLILLMAIAISFELLDFIASWKYFMIVISWLALVGLMFMVIVMIKSSFTAGPRTVSAWLSISLLVGVVILKILLFLSSRSQEQMFPLTLVDTTINEQNGTSLYLYSTDNFPNPGKSVILKKKIGFLPILVKIEYVNSFDFTKKEITENSISYFSEQGKKLSYQFSSGVISIKGNN